MWTPKSFFCWSLKTGSLIFGVIYLIIFVIAVILSAYCAVMMTDDDVFFQEPMGRQALAIYIMTVIYFIFLAILCVVFIWTLKKQRASFGKYNIVTVWLVIMSFVLAQIFVAIIITLVLWIGYTPLWGIILLFVLSIICTVILVYGLLIVGGYCRRLKGKIIAEISAQQRPAVPES